uniref:Uncharacterized protein n=1 Tax=Physcomitrium patens TaxID=3218 RepID=A0A2K1KNX0_PHYPA|nr:hypothetical protein PHYPA_006375 [Physcomitrium patens]
MAGPQIQLPSFLSQEVAQNISGSLSLPLSDHPSPPLWPFGYAWEPTLLKQKKKNPSPPPPQCYGQDEDAADALLVVAVSLCWNCHLKYITWLLGFVRAEDR